MRVLVTGAGGQVGRAALRRAAPGMTVIGLSRSDLDICDSASVAACLRENRPDVVVNAAAYTAVDQAESEPAQAERVNAVGPGVLAEASLSCGCRLIHVSTDFVFDGRASSPYPVTAEPRPLSVYGRTKLAGERAVSATLGKSAAILRTGWVYDSKGRNFLTTMLRVMAERRSVRVVSDQVGTPTSAGSVADALLQLVEREDLVGCFHWTDAGVASWYDFAVAIAEEGAAMQLLTADVEVEPITTSEYPTQARRPAYSVLDKRSTGVALGLTATHWRKVLRGVIGELTRA